MGGDQEGGAAEMATAREWQDKKIRTSHFDPAEGEDPFRQLGQELANEGYPVAGEVTAYIDDGLAEGGKMGYGELDVQGKVGGADTARWHSGLRGGQCGPMFEE